MKQPVRRWFLACIVTVVALSVALPAWALDPGDLDTSFSGDGVKTVDYGTSENFYGVAVHGSAPTGCGYADGRATVTAFTAHGGYDNDFSGDGRWRKDILGNGYSYFEACRFLPDGRLVAAGAARVASGDDRMIAMVFRPNGKPDTHFSGDGLAVIRFPGAPSVYGYDLAVQPDGKIVVVGETYDNSAPAKPGWFAVARLKPNGALDRHFSGDGRAKVNFHAHDEGVWKVLVQHDGRILLAGWVRNKADTEWNTGVARLKPNGAMDPTFSGDGKIERNLISGHEDYALGLGIRSDDKIVLGVYGHDGVAFQAQIARLRPGGGFDTTFGGGDGLLTGFQPDFNLQDVTLVGGKILVGGRDAGSGSVPMIVRLRPGGAPDPNFGTGGVADLSIISDGSLFDFAIDRHGRIVWGGRSVSDSVVSRVIG